MISTPTRVLLLGASLLLLGAILVFLGAEGGRHRLLVTGAGIISLSAISLGVGSRLMRKGRRNPLEVRREQRLWRSGPLGRLWLRAGRRLP